MQTTKNKDDHPAEVPIFPGWSIEASKDSMLVAWAILQAVAELKDVADAIDALHQRLDGIEKSLDRTNELLER
jgi:hypothetical protein